MKNLQILLAACILTMLIGSCKGDDDISIDDREVALIGQWEVVAITSDRAVDLNGDDEPNIDLFGTQEIRQCEKDNLTIFTENGPSGKAEFNVNENSLACDGNDPFVLIHEDFWILVDNNSVISFENRNDYRIIELSENILIVESDEVLDGMEYIITITYSKS